MLVRVAKTIYGPYTARAAEAVATWYTVQIDAAGATLNVDVLTDAGALAKTTVVHGTGNAAKGDACGVAVWDTQDRFVQQWGPYPQALAEALANVAAAGALGYTAGRVSVSDSVDAVFSSQAIMP